MSFDAQADVPPSDQMIADLLLAGWRKKMRHIWASPSGKLFLGPAGAWKVMHGLSTGTEMTITTVARRRP